jgi:hypothetical protein
VSNAGQGSGLADAMCTPGHHGVLRHGRTTTPTTTAAASRATVYRAAASAAYVRKASFLAGSTRSLTPLTIMKGTAGPMGRDRDAVALHLDTDRLRPGVAQLLDRRDVRDDLVTAQHGTDVRGGFRAPSAEGRGVTIAVTHSSALTSRAAARRANPGR